jgi:very-short-patch-repair endonuclease
VDSAVLGALTCRGGLATVTDLERDGVTLSALRWALRRGDVVRVAPGTVAEAAYWHGLDPRSRHVSRLRIALARHGPGAAAAAASAAVVWDLPVENGPPSSPVIVRGRSRRRPEHGGRARTAVRRRAWVDDDEITEVAGVRVTSLVRTAVDVARTVEVPWGLAVMDAVLGRGVPRAVLEAGRRRSARAPGSRRAALVITHADPRAESALESVARGVMLMLGLPVPDLQVAVSASGRRYRVDLLVREFRTVVEVDGKAKYVGDGADPERSWQEKRRRDHLLERGYEVERFVAADYWHPQRWGRSLLRAFHRACRRHGLEPPDIDPAFPAFRGAWHTNPP